MNSKECLERLLKYANINEAELITKYGYSASNDIETIKKDLNKLEQMEQNHEAVLQTLEIAAQEIDKLKEALDTLIRKLDIHLTKTENYDTAETYYSVYNDNSCEVLYPEEYELLKEVFRNETKKKKI